jgi:hypothetical protein
MDNAKTEYYACLACTEAAGTVNYPARHVRHVVGTPCPRRPSDASADPIAQDAARYRWMREVFTRSVGAGIEVNDDRLVYEQPEPGKAVRVYWYPNTPVGFDEAFGDSLDEAIDAAMREAQERSRG